MSTARANRLATETSPYLLQHAHNPVDWYPWGEEALARARDEDRPILLSIGYAACHWCHVMERESFENPTIAGLMNQEFVCIKVDREERPEIDDIYMRAVQLMSGHGGWPLTCFLTPDRRPFWGGTYFPPEPRGGMPGFVDVLSGVADAYRQRRGQVEQVADQLRDQLTARHPAGGAAELLGHDLVYRAASELHDRFDPNWGGFGSAPKFPNATGVQLLLRVAHLHHDQDLADAALFTLDQMAAGGIHDQLGGGFHRYATDARWLVPHFEKMLYDNALLVSAYLDAYRLTAGERFAAVARSTCDWVLRDMRTPEGGFAATLDADSEGVEGRYYVWSQPEIEAVLGEHAAAFCTAYGVSAGGNWEGTNILHLPRPLAETAKLLQVEVDELRQVLEDARQRLLGAREVRTRPGLDDKVLADWNGLMIASLAQSARLLDEPRYAEAAASAAEFVLEHMRRGGRLLHSWRAGEARVLGYLDDYAAMLGACVELFLTTFEARWLQRAYELAEGMVVLFWDETDGGFFLTGVDHEELLTRPKPTYDGATPSGNALATTWLQRLAAIRDDGELAGRATQTLYAFAPQVRRAPAAFTQMMLALDEHLAERREIVVVGALGDDATRRALARLWQRYAPHDLVAAVDPAASGAAELQKLPLFSDKRAADGGPNFYVCRNHACQAPTTDLEAILGEPV